MSTIRDATVDKHFIVTGVPPFPCACGEEFTNGRGYTAHVVDAVMGLLIAAHTTGWARQNGDES